ncbi:type II toxin-antitoxin system RelE/ParE family toxin [Sharpea porci]|uniref:type II toxin-antitoxin system RelE/ParE family toxin n=1 Tax=Sharpea porci TaxID=2652286 RepID=UPI0024091C71|nr:type II toxin-antitoxin system RelE/ParE family toxin [Sharpea porci]MDD6712309.1 type II toxin-antitoxin system RelE/ParE family toxin [Sharpea porci]MDY5280029.1 type II toxin-antitoxin system RelE/ParE family toxin [Sharpea porci]
MLKLRINPVVINDLTDIFDYIADDNKEYATKTIGMIYDKFENLRMFPKIGSDLSKRVTFHTNYKYIIWKNFIIIYMVNNDYLEIYRVINRYQDITKIFDS